MLSGLFALALLATAGYGVNKSMNSDAKLIYTTMGQFIIFIILLFVGCTTKSGKIESETTDKPIYIDEFTIANHPLEDSTIFKESDIILLETNDDSFIRDIDRIYRTNNNIFILDRGAKKVCIFDDQGNYQNKIQNIGQGPNEYISLMDFCIDTEKEEIVLLCDSPYKIMRFTYGGNFINEKKHHDFFRSIVMDDNYIYCNRSELNKTDLDKYEISTMDRNGEQIGNSLLTRDNIKSTMFNRGNFLSRSKFIYYTRRFDNTVYQINKDKLVEKYRFDFGQFNSPSSLMNESDIKKFSDECDEKQYIYSITEFVENEKHIMFNTNQKICVYDKTIETFTGYTSILNINFGIGSNYFFVNGYDGSIVMKIEPTIIHMLKDYIKDNENYSTLLKSVNEDDNPILFFYQFKS